MWTPLAGFEKGGWKLKYTDQRSEYWTLTEAEEKVTDLLLSPGLRVKTDGLVEDVSIGVKNGEYFSTHTVDYHGGERYPFLERQHGKSDVLTEILHARK